EESVITTPNNKPRQEMLEDHLLTLILQAQKPKDALAAAVNALEAIEPVTPNAKSIYNTLKEYFVTSDELSVAEIGKLLHESVLPTFDLYFLTPIPNFTSNELHLIEVEKAAKTVKQAAVKEQLKTLSERMKEAERNENEEDLQKLREEFSLL